MQRQHDEPSEAVPSRVPAIARSVLALVLGIAAAAIYVVGLMAPLTPSDGVPSLGAIVLFLIAPLYLAAGACLVAVQRWLRLGLAIEAALIGVSGLRLLALQLLPLLRGVAPFS